MKRKEEARYLRGHKKNMQNGVCSNDTKKYSFPLRCYRYLERTERRDDSGKICLTAKGKTGQ